MVIEKIVVNLSNGVLATCELKDAQNGGLFGCAEIELLSQEGVVYEGVFYTWTWIKEILGQRNKENVPPVYHFWMPGLVVVDNLSEFSLSEILEEMIENNELFIAFHEV